MEQFKNASRTLPGCSSVLDLIRTLNWNSTRATTDDVSRERKYTSTQERESLFLWFVVFAPVVECEASAPTTFFWYRTALDITDSIEETGQLNLPLTCCLLAAWTVVCLGMFKGIKTSVKVRRRRLETKSTTTKK